MAKTSLSKSDLQKQKQQLKLYLKLLPSLDLKRTQLMAEHAKANMEKSALTQEVEKSIADTVENLPMIANRDVKLEGLVKIDSLAVGEESIVGIKVPYLKEITFEESAYSSLATPSWIEAYIQQLKKVVEGKIRVEIMEKRAEKLRLAVRRITQHVNLFEKILIPTAKAKIQKIRILLGEAERSAVIRSKLAKALRLRQSELDLLAEAPS